MPVDEAERTRRRALLHAHLGAEGEGDMAAVLATFSPDAVMHYNGAAFTGAEVIEAAHVYMGFRPGAGALNELGIEIDRESFTDDAIVIEGRITAVHRGGEFLGFAPTGRRVELPFATFYEFDADDKLVSERVFMNLGPLNPDFRPRP